MKRLFALIPILLATGLISSNVSAAPQDEIDHLLAFVRTTPCQYERNGTMHTGSEATEHIMKKADYYADDIETAEDFIEYSATKSMMSRKNYQVHCEGQPTIKSSEWLLTELQRYRDTSD